MRNHALALALGLSAALLSAPVLAATVTGNLSVKATVVASCNIVGGSGAGITNALLNFGNVTSTLNNVDADTTSAGNSGLGVQCTNGVNYKVYANLGLQPSGSQRRMAGPGGSGGEFLPYSLYSDQGRSAAFPTSAATAVSTAANGQVQTVDIYGRIPAGTPLPSAGAYADTVVLTVDY